MSDESFLPRMWQEMKRRRVVPTVVVYPAVAWGIIEGVPTVLGNIGVSAATSEVIASGITIIAIAGFPLTLLLTWLFQVVPDRDVPRDAGPPSRWRRLVPAFSVVLVLAGCVTLATVLWPPVATSAVPTRAPRPVEIDALAILPTQVLSPEPGIDAVAISITHRLTDRLSTLPGLEVRPPFEADRYAQAAVGVDSLARALGVATLVESTAEWMGERLRMTYRIVNGTTGRQLDMAFVDGPLPSTYESVDSLVDSLEVGIRSALGRVNQEWMEAPLTYDALTVAEVQQVDDEVALYHEALTRRDVGAALRALHRADSAAARAAAGDPGWALPLVRRAWIARERSIWLLSGDRQGAIDALQASWGWADAALRVSPNEAEALRLRGLAALERASVDTAVALDRGHWLGLADADLRLAQGRHRNRAEVRYDLALVKQQQRLVAEAYAFARDAYEYDAYFMLADKAVSLLFDLAFDLSDDAAASHWCEEGRKRFRDDWMFAVCRLTLMGWGAVAADTVEAGELVGDALRAYPAQYHALLRPQLDVLAAAVFIQAGDSARARDVLELVSLDASPAVRITAAGAWLLCGDRESAVRELGRYVAAVPGLTGNLRSRRILRPLTGDPAFEALVAGAGG